MRKVDENQLHQYYALEVIILVYTEHTILKVHYFNDIVDVLKSSSYTHYMTKSCLFTEVCSLCIHLTVLDLGPIPRVWLGDLTVCVEVTRKAKRTSWSVGSFLLTVV